MVTYSTKPVEVDKPASEVFNKITNLQALRNIVDELPAEQRADIGDVEFGADSIKVKTPQVGEIELGILDSRAPEMVRFGAKTSPVPLGMEVDIRPEYGNRSTVQCKLEVEIPMMLKAMVGPYMQQAIDKFGELVMMIVNQPAEPEA